MKISEIKNNEGKINIEADVVELGPVREINKYGKNLRVTNAVIQDESGKIKLTLWNDEIEKVHKGDRVKVTNGYAKSFQDELQLTAGKFGKVEVVEKVKSSSEGEEEESSIEATAMGKAEEKKNEEEGVQEDSGTETSEEEEW